MQHRVIACIFKLSVSAGVLLEVAGCGSSGQSVFGDAGVDAGTPVIRPVDAGGADSSHTFTLVDGSTSRSDASSGQVCDNLQCFQVFCGDGGSTTLTGVVNDPKGNLPIYNARVYIPNAPLPPFDDSLGVQCERCTDVPVPLVASALTDVDGAFTLTDVPANVPADAGAQLVIQVGQWQRVVPLPAVPACTTTPALAVSTRLPRDSSEGHLPKIAISTGGADPFECLLRKVGISDSEFSYAGSSSPGRIDMYQGDGGVSLNNVTLPPKVALLDNMTQLSKYNVVILACEGDDVPLKQSKDPSVNNFNQYLNSGGRAFNTHYNYELIKSNSDLTSMVKWNESLTEGDDKSTLYASINATTFDGQILQQFLSGQAALNSAGQLPLLQWRHNVNGVKAPIETLVSVNTSNPVPAGYSGSTYDRPGPSVQQFSFNAPMDAGVDDAGATNACGKLVFTDFHVTTDARTSPLGTVPNFPSSCADAPLTAQEKALAFAFFQLSTCVQTAGTQPIPPPVVVPPPVAPR